MTGRRGPGVQNSNDTPPAWESNDDSWAFRISLVTKKETDGEEGRFDCMTWKPRAWALQPVGGWLCSSSSNWQERPVHPRFWHHLDSILPGPQCTSNRLISRWKDEGKKTRSLHKGFERIAAIFMAKEVRTSRKLVEEEGVGLQPYNK